nr:phage tail protein [Allgaiera sp.]
MPFVATAVTGFVVAAGASAAVAGAVGSIAANLLTSVALSALSHALQPRQTTPIAGIQQNVTLGGVTPESFILGKYATAGHQVSPPYVHGTAGGTPNAYLTLIVELGGIPGQTLDGIIIGGEEISITSTVHPDYGNQLGGKYAGYAWVKHYDGSQTAADPYLVAKYSADPDRPWASTAIGTGICYVIVTLLFNTSLFSSIPSLQFIVGGVPLYDPRQDSTAGGSGSQLWSDATTWAQTDNAAVMAYNIARGVTLPDGNIWGGQYGAAGLPFDNWVAAMNACDALVTNADSTTEPTYRAGYQVTVDQKPSDVIAELMKACAGQVAPMGDTLKVRVGGPGLPVYFFTDDDLIVSDSQQLQPFPGLSATHNAVTATYPEPTALWATHDAPPRY